MHDSVEAPIIFLDKKTGLWGWGSGHCSREQPKEKTLTGKKAEVLRALEPNTYAVDTAGRGVSPVGSSQLSSRTRIDTRRPLPDMCCACLA
jgi:hypothetical protein